MEDSPCYPVHDSPICLQGEDDGSTVLPVGDYLEARDGERPVGVYALLDARHNTQYVGYSRNMVLAIKVRGGLGAPRALLQQACRRS